MACSALAHSLFWAFRLCSGACLAPAFTLPSEVHGGVTLVACLLRQGILAAGLHCSRTRPFQVQPCKRQWIAVTTVKLTCRFVEVWRASKILAPEVLDAYMSHTVLHQDRPAFFRYYQHSLSAFSMLAYMHVYCCSTVMSQPLPEHAHPGTLSHRSAELCSCTWRQGGRGGGGDLPFANIAQGRHYKFI